ncbi:MAG: hypothetical protein ACKV2V_03885 [Blastocatellia bacterium]
MGNSLYELWEVSRPLVGFFRDQATAVKAYHVLTRLDYAAEKVTFAATEDSYQPEWIHTQPSVGPLPDAQGGPGFGSIGNPNSSRGMEGFAIGATVGAVLGGICLVVAAIVLPGLDIIFPGPLAAAVTGAMAGATIGGLFGVLVGSGHPTEIEGQNLEEIRESTVFVGVTPRTFAEMTWIERQWTDLGGAVVHH